MKTLQELSRLCGIKLPENLNGETLAPIELDHPLLSRDFLEQTLDENQVPLSKSTPLFNALDEINHHQDLLSYSRVLRDHAPLGLMTANSDEYETPIPRCVKAFSREAYAFLYALSCVPVGKAELQKRGVPESVYHDIPNRMIKAQLKKYCETGNICFSDYPWDMNFYCCAIVYLTRFYYIPCRCDYPAVFVNKRTGESLALWESEQFVRKDGQLDGVNGIFDPEAFQSHFSEDPDTWIGNLVHPQGLILPKTIRLSKSEWRLVLKSGDLTLALHIPGGSGYTKENLRLSMLSAKDYYHRYFPELHFAAFSSESWLYDPGLAPLLPQSSHIVSVQRQLYNYPTLEGDNQVKLEVFGDSKADISQIQARNSLENGLINSWKAGKRFHTTGMFVLCEDADKIGREQYLSSFEQLLAKEENDEKR